MCATPINLEVYRNPVVELGKAYTVCEFLEQMLVLEARSYFEKDSTDFVSDSIDWALALNPEAVIIWERSEMGETVPIAWLSRSSRDKRAEESEDIQ